MGLAWYSANTVYNLTNKMLFNTWSCPWTVTAIHLSYAALYSLISWGLQAAGVPGSASMLAGRRPRSGRIPGALAPIVVAHGLGHICTQVSMAAVAVSFSTTIKAAEPLIYVGLSSYLLGLSYATPVLLSLVPIIAGVGIASFTEATFSAVGFCGAMASNVLYAFRAVASKSLASEESEGGGEALSPLTTYGLVSCGAAPFAIAAALWQEAGKAQATLPLAIDAAGGPAQFALLLFGSCALFHLDNQLSFAVLNYVSAVTHGVASAGKRMFTIVVSIIVFRNPISALNCIGMSIAMAGVLAYNYLLPRYPPKRKRIASA
eukprot:gene4648-5692_t